MFLSAATDSYCEKPLRGTQAELFYATATSFMTNQLLPVTSPSPPHLDWVMWKSKMIQHTTSQLVKWIQRPNRSTANAEFRQRFLYSNSIIKYQVLVIIHVTSQWWCHRNKPRNKPRMQTYDSCNVNKHEPEQKKEKMVTAAFLNAVCVG